MRVYLDYQIWDYIDKNDCIRSYFQLKKEEGWEYFISVAHLEEIYRARKNETIEKKGLTDSLEMTLRSMSANGVIKPTINGIKYVPKSYDQTYQDIERYDTTNIILKRSLNRKQMDKNAYNPKDLFKGVIHKKEEEYKNIIWNEIKEINKTLPVFKHIKNIDITTEPFVKTTTQKVKRYEELKKIGQV